MRYFNTAGPVNCKKHYCLPPLERFDLDEILFLIEQEKYFILHAPRQTGKTTCLLALADYLNNDDKYVCLYFNLEVGQAAREDVAQGMNSILRELASRAEIYLNDTFPQTIINGLLEGQGYGIALNLCLTQWAGKLDKPLVLLMDEIDSLTGDTLISVLRQLRAGYDKRPAYFPHSVILCGVRDVRDYRIHSYLEKKIITGGSAFNVKAESLLLGDFNEDEVIRLYQSHTQAAGQAFEQDAIDLVWELTQGQPWLVNALGYEVCFKMKAGRDRSKTLTAGMIAKAKENLIIRRETHLDQLADKLREPRVRSVIEPVLTGAILPQSLPEDDLQYVTDLGLVKRKPNVMITNPIYKEIIPRMLTETTQDMLAFQTRWYVLPNGFLDMNKLLGAFQEFFREHSEHWVERFDYKEAGPQLLLQAFLQRIINSGGQIHREYGLGRGRVDLLITWPYQNRVKKTVIELKIKYGHMKKTIAKGLEQTAAYMDKCEGEEGHLIIFDRNPNKRWAKKIFQNLETFDGKRINVWGM